MTHELGPRWLSDASADAGAEGKKL